MQVVWINKNPWRKPGPMVYMGVLNALAFAWNDVETTLFVGAGEASDTDRDLRDFYGLEPHPQLRIERCGGSFERRRPVYDAALAFIAEQCARGEHIVVCTRELGCLPTLFKLRRRFPQLRILHECHDYYLTIRHLPHRNFAMHRRQWSERLLLPRCDGLICLTEAQRALYQQHLPRLPMIALPLGTLPRTISVEQIKHRCRARRVAYIGHLHDYKGLDTLFELAHALRAHDVLVEVFGGSARQVEALREQAARAQLHTRLRFTPFLPPRELHAQLDSMSIGLVPLRDTFYNRYLTCPVKALDFLAHGLPLFGSDLPAVREVAENAGIYCNFADVATAVGDIAELLDDAPRYAKVSRASSTRAAALTWQRRGRALLLFIDQLSRASAPSSKS